jgi:hypothetical protein
MRSADDDTSYSAGWPFPNSGFKIATAAKFHIHYRRGADVKVTAVLPKRFGKYGLTLHPAKTPLIPFRRPPRKAAGGEDGLRAGGSMVYNIEVNL